MQTTSCNIVSGSMLPARAWCPARGGGSSRLVRKWQRPAVARATRPQAWDVRSSGGIRAMIRNFHVLYVGQTELDNIGRSGTPANERRYSAERLREVFATAREIA